MHYLEYNTPTYSTDNTNTIYRMVTIIFTF